MNLGNRLVILGAVCVSCVLYQLSVYLSVLVLAVAAVVCVRSAPSAHKKQPSGPDLGLKYQHARFARRRIVPNVPRHSPAIDNSLYKSYTVTPSSPWVHTRITPPLITQQAVRISPLISSSFSHESPVKRCSSRGFATQVVSTAFHNKSPSHQSHYTGLGIFPTVHLQRSSLPLLSQRNTNMVPRPVTIKIAPLENYESPSSRLDFSVKSDDQRQTPSVDSVVSALKSRRKRSFRNVTEDELDGESKRQKRDSSSSPGSAFKSLSPSPSNVLNGMLRSTSSLLLQQQTPKINLSAIEAQRQAYSASNSGIKNNAIFCSYSSTNRVRAKQGVKRSRHKRQDSPSNKISKLHHSRTSLDVLATTTTTTSKSPTSAVRASLPSHASTDDSLAAIQPISSPEENISDKIVVTTSSLREGFSWKRQMPVYTSIYHTKPKPFYIPQCDDTVEGDQRDQQRNQIKLQNILGCVSETFRAIDVSQNKNATSPAKDFKASISTSKSVDAINTSLSSVAPVESFTTPTTTTSSLLLKSLPNPASNASFSNWVSTVDTTTTTSTLTTVSSTGVGGQEVEKIHEQNSIQFSSPRKVENALATVDVVSSANTVVFPTPKANAFTPLLTSANNSFASAPSTTSSSFASLYTSPTVTSANGSSSLAMPSFSSFVTPSAASTSSTFAPTTSGSQSQPLFAFGNVTTSSLTSPPNAAAMTSSSSFNTSGSIFQIGQNNGAKPSLNSDALTIGKTPSQNPFVVGETFTNPPVTFSSLTSSFQQPSSSLFKFDTTVPTNDKKSEAPTSTASTFQFGAENSSFKSPSSFNPVGFNFLANSTSVDGGAVGGGNNPSAVKENLNAAAPASFFGGVTPASTAGSGFSFGTGTGPNAPSSMLFGQPPSGSSFAATSPSSNFSLNATTQSFPTFNGPASFQFGAQSAPSAPFVFGTPATTTGGLNFTFNPEPTTGSSNRRLTARRRNPRPH